MSIGCSPELASTAMCCPLCAGLGELDILPQIILIRTSSWAVGNTHEMAELCSCLFFYIPEANIYLMERYRNCLGFCLYLNQLCTFSCYICASFSFKGIRGCFGDLEIWVFHSALNTANKRNVEFRLWKHLWKSRGDGLRNNHCLNIILQGLLVIQYGIPFLAMLS